MKTISVTKAKISKNSLPSFGEKKINTVPNLKKVPVKRNRLTLTDFFIIIFKENDNYYKFETVFLSVNIFNQMKIKVDIGIRSSNLFQTPF